MFKCSVQEGWQNRNRLALGICFGQPRRAHHPLRGASVDQPMDLVDGEHFWQRLDVLKLGVGECFPVSFVGPSEEELDA